MTPTELRVLLVAKYGDRSDRALARLVAPALGVHRETVRKWLQGAQPIKLWMALAIHDVCSEPPDTSH